MQAMRISFRLGRSTERDAFVTMDTSKLETRQQLIIRNVTAVSGRGLPRKLVVWVFGPYLYPVGKVKIKKKK